MKSILPVFLLGAAILIFANTALAHGALSSQEQISGKFRVVFQATADATEFYDGLAVTHTFYLLDTEDKDVPYDYALVDFSKKDGALIARVQTDGFRDLIPGATMDIAMPAEGNYVAEVIFVKEIGGGETDELAKASFDFTVISDPNLDTQPQEDNSGLLPRASVIAAMLAGIILGKFGGRLYKFIFS
jgi:hypothetical protein